MILRHMRATLDRLAVQFPVITLTGPRQSGKTTLVKAAFPGHDYVTLENPDALSYALEDPRGFLAQFGGRGAILDEAQRAPQLFSYLQGNVDENRKPGRFILTGSQNFLLLQTITQSLAGRTAVLHLLPLSMAELARSKVPPPVGHLPKPVPPKPRRGLWEQLWRGFYPGVSQEKMDPEAWCAAYVSTYLERDVRQVLQVGNLTAFHKLLGLCAGRAGQLLNTASLAADVGLSPHTAKQWLSVLETSFVVFRLEPHHNNFNKRLIKAPKLYFHDTGLLCHLLRIASPQALASHPLRGAVFENYVASEFMKNRLNLGQRPDLYFWRDSNGQEVDFLHESPSGLVAIEAKSGQTLDSDAFATLLKWPGNVGKEKVPATVVYAGNDAITRSGIQVLPWWMI
jgi:hypothetical protein